MSGDPDTGGYLTGELLPAPIDTATRDVSVIPTARRTEIAGAWLLSVRSAQSRTAYRGDIDQWFAWADEFEIDALRPTMLHANGYREYLTTGRFPRRGGKLARYADSTVGRKLTAVSSFLTYGARHHPHDVPANPMALVDRPEPADESTGTALDLDQVARFVDAAEAMGPRELALVMLFLGTGLRVSGIADAGAGDVGERGGTMTITVRIKGGKRTVYAIPDDVADALRTYLAGRTTGPLIKYRKEWPSRQVIAHAIDRIARAAGLGGEGITPHDLRHTFATLALDEGVTIRDLQHTLRHKDPRTTDGYDQARKRLNASPGRAVTAAIARMRQAARGV